MGIEFFELKFLITDSFYSEVLKNKYSFEQSSGICYESFSEYINCDSIECIVSISTIIRLKIRHELQLTEYDIKNINKILRLVKVIPLNTILNDSENEYLEEDIQIIEYEYNKLVK